MMCQRNSRPAHGRHSQDCGDTRGRGGERDLPSPLGGAVWSAQISAVHSSKRRTPHAARWLLLLQGNPIKVKTCMLSRLAQKETQSIQG